MSMTTSDGIPAVMPVSPTAYNTGGNGGWGGDWGAWIILFLIFGMFGWGGFGGFGGGFGGNSALTRADLCSEFNFNGLENSVRGIQQGICDSTFALNSNLMSGFHGVDNAICNLAPASPVQQQGNGILWVQGEAGARSYMVAPGASVLLMDSDSEAFYIKSADPSGMPMPLRIFDYKERVSQPVRRQDAQQVAETASEPAAEYVTRAEFESFSRMVEEALSSPAPAKS